MENQQLKQAFILILKKASLNVSDYKSLLLHLQQLLEKSHQLSSEQYLLLVESYELIYALANDFIQISKKTEGTVRTLLTLLIGDKYQLEDHTIKLKYFVLINRSRLLLKRNFITDYDFCPVKLVAHKVNQHHDVGTPEANFIQAVKINRLGFQQALVQILTHNTEDFSYSQIKDAMHEMVVLTNPYGCHVIWDSLLQLFSHLEVTSPHADDYLIWVLKQVDVLFKCYLKTDNLKTVLESTNIRLVKHIMLLAGAHGLSLSSFKLDEELFLQSVGCLKTKERVKNAGDQLKKALRQALADKTELSTKSIYELVNALFYLDKPGLSHQLMHLALGYKLAPNKKMNTVTHVLEKMSEALGIAASFAHDALMDALFEHLTELMQLLNQVDEENPFKLLAPSIIESFKTIQVKAKTANLLSLRQLTESLIALAHCPEIMPDSERSVVMLFEDYCDAIPSIIQQLNAGDTHSEVIHKLLSRIDLLQAELEQHTQLNILPVNQRVLRFINEVVSPSIDQKVVSEGLVGDSNINLIIAVKPQTVELKILDEQGDYDESSLIDSATEYGGYLIQNDCTSKMQRIELGFFKETKRVTQVQVGELFFAIPTETIVHHESIITDSQITSFEFQSEHYEITNLFELFGQSIRSNTNEIMLLQVEDVMIAVLVEKVLKTQMVNIQPIHSMIAPMPAITHTVIFIEDNSPGLLLNPGELYSLTTLPIAALA